MLMQMKFMSNLMQSNKNPDSGLSSILKGWINAFREGGLMMLTREKGF
jgi:hypothetical protein